MKKKIKKEIHTEYPVIFLVMKPEHNNLFFLASDKIAPSLAVDIPGIFISLLALPL